MKRKHDKTEEAFIAELLELKTLRRNALSEYFSKQHGSVDDVKGVIDLFRVADELTNIITGAITIEHELTAQVVAVLASTIYGITRGSVETEIIDLITTVLRRRAIIQNAEDKTKH